MRRATGPAAVLLAILLSYVALATVIGRFSGYDEPWYKSAGREWGLHGRFASPELTGFLPDVDPPPETIYFVYPPLYSFLFGVLVRVAGFGWRQCVFYDAAIHAVLAGQVYLLARRLGGDRLSPRGALLAALAVLPLGTVEGRPDELAIAFGMAGLLVALRGPITPLRAMASGAIFGLCAGTSVATAVMMGFIAFVVLVTEPVPWFRKALLCLGWGLAAGLVLALVVAPILLPYPRAIDQYFAVARMHVSVGNIATRFVSGLRFLRHLILSNVPVLAVGLALSAFNAGAGGPRRWLRLWVGPLLGLGFMLSTVPNKATYLWFIGPWVLAATVAELAMAWPRMPAWSRGGVGLILAAALALGSEPAIKSSIALASLPAEQRPGYNDRALAEAVPPGTSVLTLDSWWFLARDHVVYDARWACVPPGAIDFVVLSGNGSGAPGRPLGLDIRCNTGFPLRQEYREVSDDLNRRPPTLLGRPITNSAYGFGNIVYRRVPAPARTEAPASPPALQPAR